MALLLTIILLKKMTNLKTSKKSILKPNELHHTNLRIQKKYKKLNEFKEFSYNTKAGIKRDQIGLL